MGMALAFAIEYCEKAIKEAVLDTYCNLGNIHALGLGEAQVIKLNTPKAVSCLAKGAY
jgi:TPR repeat protein